MRIAVALALTAAVALGACKPRPDGERFAGSTMGTTYEVTVTGQLTSSQRRRLQGAIDSVLDDIDRHLSAYDPASEISRFNAAPGTDWIAVSPTLRDAVEQSLQVSRQTGGAFDITVAPLVAAWGFGSGAASDPPAPDATQLVRLRTRVGHDRLESRSDPPALRKTVAGLRIDFDGIAPGIAVDRIAASFEAAGVGNYLVEIGGEVRARGVNPVGRPWRVAIEAPLAGERRAHAVIELDRGAVSTSGDYRDFRRVDGRRVSHTIDPRSAAPVTHALASVTVIDASAARADALATALMVLGPEDGLRLARRLRLPAYFIVRQGSTDAWIESETAEFTRLRRPLH